MALRARHILADKERVQLFSPTTGKPYFSYRGDEQSRPLNADLYTEDELEFGQLPGCVLRGIQREQSPRNRAGDLLDCIQRVRRE